LDGLRNDASHRTAPPGMHGANVSARRMRDQNRNAIGRACRNRKAFDTRDECIAFQISGGSRNVGIGDLSHLSPMHLPLLEEAIAAELEARSKARAVLTNGFVVIA
jgi:hypothetical protein